MKRRKAESRIGGVEILAVAGLVIALAVLGVAGVGFQLEDLFGSVSVPR